MEQAPKDTNESVSPFEILEEEASEKKYLFDAKVLRGKESFDAIVASVSEDDHETLPDYDDLHTKQKLLLSRITPEPAILSTVQQPKPGTTAYRFISVGTHGLEIGGKVFDYDSDTRNQLHHNYVGEIVGDAQDDEEVYTRLTSANSEFRSLLRGRAEATIRSEIQKEYDDKCSELRAEFQGRNLNVSMRSLRKDFIASIKPDFDDDTVKSVAQNTEQAQTKYKKQQESLSYHSKKFEKSYTSLQKATKQIEKGEEILERRRGRLAETQEEYKKLLAAGADNKELEKAQKQLDFLEAQIEDKEHKLEELSKKTEDTISDSDEHIKGMNRAFVNVDTSIVKYGTIKQLSEMLQKPADSLEVEKVMSRILENDIKEDEKYYQIATAYHSEADKIKDHNYVKEIAGEKSIIDPNELSRVLEKKQIAAFICHNQLYNHLSEDETKQLLNHNFAAEYEQRRREYAMELGNLTSQEYDDIQHSRNIHFSADSLVDALSIKYCNYHDNISPARRANLDYAIHVLHMAILDDAESELDKDNLHAPKEVQVRVFDRYRETDSKTLSDEEFAYDSLLSESVHKNLNVADAKKQILRILSPKDKEQLDDYSERLEQMAASIQKRLEKNVKYYDVLARFGSCLCQDDIIELNNEIDRLSAEKEAAFESLPEDRVAAEEEKEMRDFSSSLFGEDINETFVYPTGFVTIDKDGHYRAISVDTSSNDVAERISANKQDLWRSYLRGEEIGGSRCKQTILSSLNKIVESDYNEYLDYATDDERRVVDFCREYQIAQPSTISTATGSLNEQLFGIDCDNAKYCIEHFGRYINNIDVLSSSTSDISNSVLMESVKEFLADGSRVGPGLYSSYLQGDQSLSIKCYTAVADELGYDAANSLLINSITSGVYSKNEKNLELILHKILGDHLDISIVTAMRLTGKKIMSPMTRRKVAMRAIFTANYNRYLCGKEINNPQMAKLIERVDHIEYGQ